MVDGRILRTLSECRDTIAESCTQPLRLEQVALEANYSPFHFHRLFKSVYGETPMAFLARQRLNTCRKLLRETDSPVWMIALQVGYSSDTTFVHWFRSHTGLTPSEYRKTARLSYQLGRLWSPIYIPGCFFGPNRNWR